MLQRFPRALALLPALLSLQAFFVGDAARASEPVRPNIVFIMADDLGWGELGSYGQTKIRTPHLDQLAQEGMRFTQHYSGAPVCAPARCVLMTGLHSGHAQIRGNRPAQDQEGNRIEGQHPITSEALTIASVLQDAGYKTGAMGKWGLGPVHSSGAPHRQGFDLFFGYNCQAVAHSYYPTHLWRNEHRVPLNERPIPGHARQPEGEVRFEDWESDGYAPEAMLGEAIQFLKDNREEPFFLYLPFIEPHVAIHPPREIVDSYPLGWDDRPYRGQCSYTPYPRPRAGYAALITSLDQQVGAILQTLDQLELADNTLVVFTSDNGTTLEHDGDPVFGVGGVDGEFFNSTAGLRGRKGSLYEGGIRVPMIVRWPGCVAAGSTSDLASYFPDHFPTLCESVGLPTPEGLDGISLLPTWLGQGEQTPRNPMVWVFTEYGGQVAVRLGDYKVLRQGLRTRNPGPWQVYDLVNDPNETTDLAAEHPERIAQAEAILREQMLANETFPLSLPQQ